MSEIESELRVHDGATLTAGGTSGDDGLVRIRNLCKSFGSVSVLKDISLDVGAGEVVAIVGPSGSGKSTLLRCINMLETPQAGTLAVGDMRFDCAGPIGRRQRAALRNRLGMVFQSFNLFPHMSVLENICLPQRRVLGRSRAAAHATAQDLLDKVGLGDKGGAYPNQCSGGQQQRIAIARALALDPEVMLFDEPTSALDPELGLEVLSVMSSLARSGMTMIVVTHEMSFAEKVSSRTVFMAEGEIVEAGPSAALIGNPQTERAQRFFNAVNHR